MKNDVYYVKPNKSVFSEAIDTGFAQALSLCSKKGYSNIKIIVNNMNLVSNPPNYISDALNIFFTGRGEELTKQLKRSRGFPISDFPKDGLTTGVNLLLETNFSINREDHTIVVLIWADSKSLPKIESSLFRTEIDLVAVVHQENPEINEQLAALNATNISKTLDPNVDGYSNSIRFSPDEQEILNRLKTINVAEIAAHTPTKEVMANVINELKSKRMVISYEHFLGFLVNEVGFELEKSVELLNWKRKFFGR